VLRLLEPLQSSLEVPGLLVRRHKLVTSLRTHLAQRGLGAVELADEVVDPRLALDVLDAELCQTSLAVLELRFLGLGAREPL
jgi:hypothetical protein